MLVNSALQIDGTSSAGLLPEDSLRADMYEFLASLLRGEPGDDLIGHVAALQGDSSAIGSASSVLATLATKIANDEIRDEYMRLFIGVGRGEILPYASYYLTGFLNDKPLAKLRNEMQAMGIERAEGVKDPEDHIASLFDIMAGLIRGSFGAPNDLAAQAAFFKTHIDPWAPLLMQDIEAAKSAVFYAPVGTIGRAFLEIESEAFDMDEAG
ncbi:MAG: molecular chaperone TorD [Alphaproteobacteria bacterium]|nr:molecular chaperone TorD [Alphaproteobacteria bacterium]